MNDQGQSLGVFDTQSWISDNATALEENATGVGLQVRVLASMSGVLINRRVYPGEEWKKAAEFFAERPFLMHHNSYGDAIGRIETGEFEQKRTGRAFENDWKRPVIQELGKEPRPSGIVYVSGMITDPKIILQVQDKRVLHVSQGSRAKQGLCSICQSNWAEGQWCEHEPGRWYDKETGERVAPESENAEFAYTIIRDMIPIEVSAVVDPALEAARILEYSMPMDSKTQDSWNRHTSSINTADTILEQDLTDELILIDRNGEKTHIRLVNDKTAEIKSAPVKPVNKEVTMDTATNNTVNHNQPAPADINPVVAGSSDNGANKMDWEKKFADRTEELLETKSQLKEAQIESERAKAKVEAKDSEIKSLNESLSAKEEKIKELEEEVKDEAGASKKLLEEVRTVYLDRYCAALKTSRPDLKDEDIDAAREALKDQQLDAIKLLVADKEKFAKAPIETSPSQTAGTAGETTVENTPVVEDEEEEDSDDFDM